MNATYIDANQPDLPRDWVLLFAHTQRLTERTTDEEPRGKLARSLLSLLQSATRVYPRNRPLALSLYASAQQLAVRLAGQWSL